MIRSLWGLVLVAALSPCVSFAAKPGAKSDPAPKEGTTTGDPESDVAKAREHLRKAGVHYDLQEFRKALTEFREAYRLKNDPVILFGPPMRRHRRGRFHPDAGVGSGDPSSGQ